MQGLGTYGVRDISYLQALSAIVPKTGNYEMAVVKSGFLLLIMFDIDSFMNLSFYNFVLFTVLSVVLRVNVN